MKKFTKFSAIVSLLFFIYSCGYTPLYQSESSNFYFSEIKTNTNNLYFNTIKNFLSKYTIDKGQENKYSIEIDIYKNKEILSRDSSGNPKVYIIKINANIKVLESDTNLISKKYSKKFKYSHDSSIFDLNLYEKEIEKKLIKQIADELIISIIGLDKDASPSKAKKIKLKIKSEPEIGYSKKS